MLILPAAPLKAELERNYKKLMASRENNPATGQGAVPPGSEGNKQPEAIQLKAAPAVQKKNGLSYFQC